MMAELGMSDFAGLRSGEILDTSRRHEELIGRMCKSELAFDECPKRSYPEAFPT